MKDEFFKEFRVSRSRAASNRVHLKSLIEIETFAKMKSRKVIYPIWNAIRTGQISSFESHLKMKINKISFRIREGEEIASSSAMTLAIKLVCCCGCPCLLAYDNMCHILLAEIHICVISFGSLAQMTATTCPSFEKLFAQIYKFLKCQSWTRKDMDTSMNMDMNMDSSTQRTRR